MKAAGDACKKSFGAVVKIFKQDANKLKRREGENINFQKIYVMNSSIASTKVH